jgi:hypothetical protein
MNVNGSSAPVVFSCTASNNQALQYIVCILKDDGTTAFNNFGAKSALTNGILMQVTQNGTANTIALMKDNSDMAMTFPTNQFGNGAVLSILSLVTAEGFGATNNCFIGVLHMTEQVFLSPGDSVSVTIQDNLSGVQILQMSCGFKVG